MVKSAILKTLLLTGIISIFQMSCSSEKSGILNKAYHNTTAHYNAYYYANERIKEIEAIVESSNQNNFNDILLVYPPFDTTLASTYKTQTEDCIKKSSIAIQMHQNSKWVDDSYILLGLARFYDRDFVNAIETFKYVNTKSEDDDARHLALAHLIRTFTDYKEFANAVAVIDYLKREELSKNNEKLVLLNTAYLYQQLENHDKMVESLVQVAPMLTQSEGRAKMYFIIAQVYQELGFEAEAYNNYQECLSSNPIYELYFYARLNMAQVAQLKNNSDIRSVRKHFRKLLTDKKNKEFKDKIYYEMAEFENKQGNTAKAIEYYQSSTQSSLNNNRQKGMSFLKLGMIYYDHFKDYELARNYYDSTIQVLPKDYENYKEIKERQEVLDEFVTQLNIINTQDSLLALASMDSTSLMIRLEEIAKQQQAEEEEKQKQANRKSRSQSYSGPFTNESSLSSGPSWYFDNPSLVSIGQTEFRKKWGSRPLEDHWRRSNKSIGISANEERINQNNTGQQLSQSDDNTSEGQENISANLYSQLPFSEDQKNKALDQIEEAYYKLGNIYNFKLEEKGNAVSSFQTLLSRFPKTEYEPEVLYLLYLLLMDSNEEQSNLYKNTLLDKYPYSTYSKLIINPSYTEDSNEATAQLKIIYTDAYKMYKSSDYSAALNLISNALNKYPETSFTARLILLRILIIGQTEDIGNYKYELDKFIKEYPDSDVTEYAKTLLEASDNFEKKEAKRKGVKFIEDFAQTHYFILVYNSSEGLTDKIMTIVQNFNEASFANNELTASNLLYDDNQAMILVTEFIGIETALNYYSTFANSKKEIEVLSNSKIHTFVITKDNFGIFYQNKGLEEYSTFFKRNYN